MDAPTHTTFERTAWAALRDATPLLLDEGDLAALSAANEQVSMAEVTDVYLPLSRLLNLHAVARAGLGHVTDTFLGRPPRRVPFLVAVAGSVAVGKSTTARLLQALLERWPEHPRVALVTTDGFLHPNAVLHARGLLDRKGFPESYDRRRLLSFLDALRRGDRVVRAPVYSHVVYDVVPDEEQEIVEPDIVIVEGLTVLQAPHGRAGEPFASDFFDVSIYVDADERDIEQWYLERFAMLRRTAFLDEQSFFRHFAGLDDETAEALARSIWASINRPNLHENVLPTRARAHVILEKGSDHAVRRVHLRI